MKQLDSWLAIDPLDPAQLHDRTLRVRTDFKPRCANDLTFLSDPKRCYEVTLWPPSGSGGQTVCENSLTLSVAEVRRVSKKAVDIFFGAIIERNGKHISELEGYDLRIL